MTGGNGMGGSTWRRDPGLIEAAWQEDLWQTCLASGNDVSPPVVEWLRLIQAYQQVVNRRLERIEALLLGGSFTGRGAGGNGHEEGVR